MEVVNTTTWRLHIQLCQQTSAQNELTRFPASLHFHFLISDRGKASKHQRLQEHAAYK
jgi:hypothetical protein